MTATCGQREHRAVTAQVPPPDAVVALLAPLHCCRHGRRGRRGRRPDVADAKPRATRRTDAPRP
eukprot:7334878-Prymnesium_polylepis.1